MKHEHAVGRNISLRSLYLKYFLLIASAMSALVIVTMLVIGTIAARSKSEALDRQSLQSLALIQSSVDSVLNDTITQAYKIALFGDTVRYRLLDRDYVYDFDAMSLRLQVLRTLKMVLRNDLDLNVSVYTGVNDYVLSPLSGAQKVKYVNDSGIADTYRAGYKTHGSNFFVKRTIRSRTDPTYARDVLTYYCGTGEEDFVAFDIDLKLFNKRVQGRTEDGVMLLLDENGQSLFEMPDEWENCDLTAFISADSSGEIIGDVEISGEKFRVYSARSSASPMSCVLLVSDEIRRLAVNDFMHSMLIVLLFTLLLSLGLALIISQRVFRPIGVIRDFIGSRGSTAPQSGIGYEVDHILRSILNAYQENSQLEKEQLQAYEQMRSARVLALQQQMTPHFLYNTLQAIYWLNLEESGFRTGRTAESISSLSGMSRFCMEAGTVQVPVADEIVYVEEYLRLMKLRHGEKIRWSVEISDDARKRLIPRISIQPLVENAVRHSLCHMDDGMVKIIAGVTDGCLSVIVRDNGLGMTQEAIDALYSELDKTFTMSNRNIALLNLNQRLKLIYGPGASVTVRKVNDMLEVGFIIPEEKP